METKTLTQMMSEYRVYTDKIEKMYVEKKMRERMGGDRGIHLVVFPEQDPLIQEGVNL